MQVQPTRHPRTVPRGLVWRVALRCLPAAAVWALLTEADPGSWVIGVPVVLAAVTASLALGHPETWQLSIVGLARFVPFFAWHAFTGSVDVALRALRPRMPIDPSFQRYHIRLAGSGPARVVFVNTVSLLPGTLSADLDDRELTVHTLSGGARTIARLEALEARVADLFGETVSESA